MSYYRTCPGCGANLDPGEICEDCRDKARVAHKADYTGLVPKWCPRLAENGGKG